MSMKEREKLQIGDRVDDYEVTDVDWFGPLPRAVIVAGSNTGVPVILTSPWKDGRP